LGYNVINLEAGVQAWKVGRSDSAASVLGQAVFQKSTSSSEAAIAMCNVEGAFVTLMYSYYGLYVDLGVAPDTTEDLTTEFNFVGSLLRIVCGTITLSSSDVSLIYNLVQVEYASQKTFYV